MDAATLKQKACIKGLFVQGGLPDCIFKPLHLWKISKQNASFLMNNLRLMIKYDHEELKDEICQRLLGKNVFQIPTRTVDELEEEKEQAPYDPTNDDWLDQQTYSDDVLQKERIQEWKAETLAELKVVV